MIKRFTLEEELKLELATEITEEPNGNIVRATFTLHERYVIVIKPASVDVIDNVLEEKIVTFYRKPETIEFFFQFIQSVL